MHNPSTFIDSKSSAKDAPWAYGDAGRPVIVKHKGR